MTSVLQDQFVDFFTALSNSPETDNVFNPWYDSDPKNDKHERTPDIRRRQFHQYLKERTGRARLILVGEALGYQGGHFSGIPMTSERILLGHQLERGVMPEHVFSEIPPERTSQPRIQPKGFTEPTATIVWGMFAVHSINTYSVVLWNIFPWHPFKSEKGLLSNRTPRKDELSKGIHPLRLLRENFKDARIVAVGNSALSAMQEYDIQCHAVRHPAYGGAPKFRRQMGEIFTKNESV